MINLLDEYKKKHPRNGKMEGVQSLNNKKTYVFQYDETIDDFVGRWIETPSFVRESLDWGSTNNTNNTTNEWSKNIVYTDEDYLVVKNVLHGVVMDERDNIYLNSIITSSITVAPSSHWEDGTVMYFWHLDGSKTILDFFN